MNDKPPGIWTLLEDNSGGFSTMRFAFLLWLIVLCFNFTYTSVSSGKMVGLDASLVTLTAALAVTKTVQRFGEKADDTTPPTV
jgi:hypothetical protein